MFCGLKLKNREVVVPISTWFTLPRLKQGKKEETADVLSRPPDEIRLRFRELSLLKFQRHERYKMFGKDSLPDTVVPLAGC